MSKAKVIIEDSNLDITLSINGEEVKSVTYSKDGKEVFIDDEPISFDAIISLKFSGHRKAMARFIKSLDKHYDMACEFDDEYTDITPLLILIGEPE